MFVEEILLKSETNNGRDIKELMVCKHPDLNFTEDFYLTINGKLVYDESTFSGSKLMCSVQPRLCGGKGGFGSMLRAIGAQIEKTTNREACRDLSGRRLRDINEEQRLKNWIVQQAEREGEAKERKKKKMEKLLQEPKHEFKDEKYTDERLKLTETINDSVEQGLKAKPPPSEKRKAESSKKKKSKKAKGMLEDFDVSSDDSDFDSNQPGPSTSVKAL